ncbi:MAG TPA: MFS transporter [Solirubrobacteraceae bacterium]|nr:MFS transporter [Solirubrobacteraceae bacterium]
MASSRYFEPLKYRNFALLWSGQAVSQFGDGVFTVTLAIEALRLDHRAIGLSYVLAARLLPAVMFTLAGGVLADRVPRRLALLASDLACGAAVAAVTVLVATGEIHLIALVLLAFVFGLGDAVFFPAAMAITPELVPPELLVGASALDGTSFQVAGVLIGPAIGGVLVGVLGAAWGFGIDAATFLISAGAIMAMSGGAAPVRSGQSPLSELREGLRFCASKRWLWATTLGASLGNFVAFSPLGVMVPLLVKHVLHGGGIALGLVLAAGGLGGVTATVIAGRRAAPRHRLVHLWVGWGLSGFGVLGLGFVPDLWLAGGVAFVTYGLDAYGSVMFNPLIQEGVPAALLGRVASVDYLFGFALSPLGLVAAGAAADAIGVRPTLIVGGAITALTTFIPLLPGVEDPTLEDAVATV